MSWTCKRYHSILFELIKLVNITKNLKVLKIYRTKKLLIIFFGGENKNLSLISGNKKVHYLKGRYKIIHIKNTAFNEETLKIVSLKK